MPEEQFDQNFVWYEWSFVCPEDVPSDDLHTTGANENPEVSGFGAAPRAEQGVSKPIPVVHHPRWTT